MSRLIEFPEIRNESNSLAKCNLQVNRMNPELFLNITIVLHQRILANMTTDSWCFTFESRWAQWSIEVLNCSERIQWSRICSMFTEGRKTGCQQLFHQNHRIHSIERISSGILGQRLNWFMSSSIATHQTMDTDKDKESRLRTHNTSTFPSKFRHVSHCRKRVQRGSSSTLIKSCVGVLLRSVWAPNDKTSPSLLMLLSACPRDTPTTQKEKSCNLTLFDLNQDSTGSRADLQKLHDE